MGTIIRDIANKRGLLAKAKETKMQSENKEVMPIEPTENIVFQIVNKIQKNERINLGQFHFE